MCTPVILFYVVVELCCGASDPFEQGSICAEDLLSLCVPVCIPSGLEEVPSLRNSRDHGAVVVSLDSVVPVKNSYITPTSFV